MSDEIFVPEPTDEDRPVDYVANPLRVQLSPTQRNAYGRSFQRIDVLALAANIVARETECRQLRQDVSNLRDEVLSLGYRIAQLESRPDVTTATLVLRAIREALRDADESGNEDDDEL